MRQALVAAFVVIALGTPVLALSPDGKCLAASGNAGAKCLMPYLSGLEKCRKKADAACEAALRATGGPLDRLLAAPEVAIAKSCGEIDTLPLGYLDLDDLQLRVPEACQDWGEDLSDATFAGDPAGLSPEALKCQNK
jgi:hypothetical protein